MSSGASFTYWVEGASLALVGHSSSDSVTIKIPYDVDVSQSFPIGLIKNKSDFVRPIKTGLGKSTICPCMEYYCLMYAGAPIYYLELSDKLQKQIQDYLFFTCYLSWTLGSSTKCS